MPVCNDIVKRRMIRFKPGGPDDIAQRAAELLEAVGGVSRARIHDDHTLSIHYDIRVLTLQTIEQALADVGFELSDSIVCKVKRELIAYCEDNQRDSLQLDMADDNAEHQQVEQGAHDPRPYNWRNYT